MKKTPKQRLKQEFETGDSYPEICKRLTKEGLGRGLKSGKVGKWTPPILSRYCIDELGLRKNRTLQAKPRRTFKQRQQATPKKKTLEAIIRVLQIDSLPAEDRITLALLAGEAVK